MEKILCLLLALLILGHAYVIRRIVGSWVFPACINSLFWFLLTIIPLLVVFDAPVNPLAMLYIFISSVAFSMPALFFPWREAFAANIELAPARHEIFRSKLLSVGFFATTSISMVCWIAFSVSQGFSITSMATDLMATAQQFMGARYGGDLVSNVFSQAANILGYVGSALGGLVYRNYKKRSAKLAIIFLALLPSLFVMIVQASKGMLFLCVAFFFSGILLHRIGDGKARLFERAIKVRTVFLVCGAVFPVVTISFLARGSYASGDGDLIRQTLLKLWISYSCSQLYSFSDWFSFYIGMHHLQPYAVESPAYGYFTFMSVFRWLGDTREAVPGVYEEYYRYGDYVVGNIYTQYRGLIQDYGLAFSQIVLVAMGAAAHGAYYNLLTKPSAPVSAALFVLMMGCIYTSFIVSLLIWDSSYATFIVLALALSINSFVSRRRSGSTPRTLGVLASSSGLNL